ncbi:tetratricopeptide repeat protein [Bacteroidia bacterium]|nr:tetratricopeptide repeat protein [Bacteroidia bacterium]MDB4107284.1 tetratricopeptide repeat protein [Bacteroidia bacterium]MDB9882400.1 tetratricopeptide repeat protein [Bacteroidia bacterium]
MMKFLKSIILTITLAVLLAANVVDYFQKANAHMAKKNYALAIEMYEKALESPSLGTDKNREAGIVKGLALAHLKTKNYLMSEIYFERLMAAESQDSEVLLSYAKMLQTQKRYDKAIEIYNAWGVASYKESEANGFKSVCENFLSNNMSSDLFQISPLEFNSAKYSEFSPFIHPRGYLVFTSNRPIAKSNRLKINGELSTNLLRTKSLIKEESGDVQRIKNLDRSIYNQGSACYDASGNKMFFTANVIKKVEMFSKDEVQYTLGIYESRFDGFKWSVPVLLNFFKTDYNCAYPAVSSNGDTLVFSSDVSGGTGGMDLYMAVRRGDKWSRAENLGSDVNSGGNDVFPFIVPSGNVNEIYFASDGRPGQGGLDIFSTVSTDFVYSEPELLPGPINSSYDDFGFCSTLDNSFGYFSTNREGSDDIYFFSNKGYEINHLSPIEEDTIALVNDDSNNSKEYETIVKHGIEEVVPDPTLDSKIQEIEEPEEETETLLADEDLKPTYATKTVHTDPPSDGRDYDAIMGDDGTTIYKLRESKTKPVLIVDSDESVAVNSTSYYEEGEKELIFVDGKEVYISKGSSMYEIHKAVVAARAENTGDWSDASRDVYISEKHSEPRISGADYLSISDARGYFLVFYSAKNLNSLKLYRDQNYSDATLIEGKNGFYMLTYPLSEYEAESQTMFNNMKSRFSQAWIYKAK